MFVVLTIMLIMFTYSIHVLMKCVANKFSFRVYNSKLEVILWTMFIIFNSYIVYRFRFLENINVEEIMISRVDAIAVDVKTNFSKVKSVIIESGFSRIPVLDGSFDNVKGILYVKDLLPHHHKPNTFRWQSIIRPPYYVPETKKINDLLEEFQTQKNHMAIVVDEYGGTSGIITMEDILEEIVGDITDESDDEKETYTLEKDGSYIFEGKTLLNDFFKIVETDADTFESIKGDADTLAGLLLEIKGEIPQKREEFDYKNHQFIVEAVDNRRIKKIRFIPPKVKTKN